MKNVKFKGDNKIKLAFGLNIAILSSVVVGFIMFFAQLFPGPAFEKPLINNFKYYSLILNTLELGLSIAMIVFLAKLIYKNKAMPNALHILNFVLTASLMFNMLFTILYLVPMGYITLDETKPEMEVFNPIMLLTETNLFFNVVVPSLALSQFAFCIKNTNVNIKHLPYLLILPTIYSIFYVSMSLTHIGPDGTIAHTYDWYWICLSSKYFLILMAFIFIGFTILIGYSLIVLNKKVVMTKDLTRIILYSFALFCSLFGTIWMFSKSQANEVYNLTQVVLSKFMYITNIGSMFVVVAAVFGLIANIRTYAHKTNFVPNWISNIIFYAAIWALITILFNSVSVFKGLVTTTPWETAKFREWKFGYSRHLIFEHVFTPNLMLIIYFLCEHRDKNIKINWFGALTFGIYVTIYIVLFYANLNTPYPPNNIDPYWDPYKLFKALGKETGAKLAWLLAIGLYICGYVASFITWLINRKIHIGYPKAQKILLKKVSRK